MSDSVKISAAILTTSDSRRIEDDESGSVLKSLLDDFDASVVEHLVVSDDRDAIRDKLIELAEKSDINLILTTGGTGLGPRDNTPEATRLVLEREAPGIIEAMRRETASATPMAMLSRGVAGSRTGTLIINLPGSPKGVRECFAVIAPVLAHAIRIISGDTKH